MPRRGRLAMMVALAVVLGGATAGGARQALRSTRLAPLASGQQPSPSLFGINTGTYDTSEARLARDLPTAMRLGARWVHFTGDSIKYSHGRVSFALLDSEVDSARRLGLGVVISLGGIRAACSLTPAPSDPTHCPPTTAHDLSIYATYLARLLRHFAGRVAYYESWVEPNHTAMWAGGVNPAQYATLLESPALSFVQAAFWFNQRDYQTGLANPDPGFFAHYGLLFNDFSPKPAAAVFERYAAAGG